LSFPEIVKETGISYKTAKKYAEISTILQLQSPAQQRSVVEGCSPKFAPAKTKRPSDATSSYAYYENVPYYRPVSVALPSGRGIVNVTDAKPLVPAKPLNKMQKEQEELKNRKGIDVSWVSRENKKRRMLNERNEQEEARDILNAENDKKCAKAVDYINKKLIENKKSRDRSIFQLDESLEPDNGLTESGVRDAVKNELNLEEEKQHKIAMNYKDLRTIQNKEIYRLKKKQINEKFVGDIVSSVFGIVGDVVKSAIILNSKPVKAKLVKKPMKTRVVKLSPVR